MKVYFATWLFDKTLGQSLTKLNGKSRLLSYHFLCEGNFSSQQIKEFCVTGKLDPTKKKK
ncbi:MAG TPA: hypothetical protein VLA13_08740 [Massilibacterium sp.]|nr:hypothetical protein [Massilibacterium sp.]